MDEGDRHENHGERERGGADREPDLGGGCFGRLHRVHVFFFDEAENIFEHDDGVVDYDSHRERQREQGHAVEREAHPQDQRVSRDNRNGNRNCGYERRGDRAEEKEHDDRGAQAAEPEMLLHGVNGGTNEGGRVARKDHVDADWQRAFDRFVALLDAIHDFDRVLARLLAHDQRDRIFVVPSRQRARLFDRVFDRRDVADRHRPSFCFADNYFCEIRHLGDAAQRAQHLFGHALLHAAAGILDVLPRERGADLLDRDARRVQLVGIDVNVNFTLATADDVDRADAVNRFEWLLQAPARHLGELFQALVAGERDRHDRHRVEIELLHLRWLGSVGQLIEHR